MGFILIDLARFLSSFAVERRSKRVNATEESFPEAALSKTNWIMPRRRPIASLAATVVSVKIEKVASSDSPCATVWAATVAIWAVFTDSDGEK